jgi:hypothetical protein
MQFGGASPFPFGCKIQCNGNITTDKLDMIDKIAGHIIISGTIEVKHGDLKQDIAALRLGRTNAEMDFKNGWCWLQENNVFADTKYFNFLLGFYENKLKEIHFCMSDTEYSMIQSHDDLSNEKEMEDLERYNNWLESELGSERDFEWGTVWASYDPKSGGSSIGLRYK